MENSSKVKIAVGPEKLCDFEWRYIDGEEIHSQKQDFLRRIGSSCDLAKPKLKYPAQHLQASIGVI